ncbi:MAG: type II toxin-antitoxin system RelE/ParE family toxin [Pseudomonadota bacterium]
MIKSFRYKGLEAFFRTGSKAGIQAHHAERLKTMLFALDLAVRPADMNAPGWRLHALTGKLKGYWSLSVSGNWRLIFRFQGPDAELLDYLDYH